MGSVNKVLYCIVVKYKEQEKRYLRGPFPPERGGGIIGGGRGNLGIPIIGGSGLGPNPDMGGGGGGGR